MAPFESSTIACALSLHSSWGMASFSRTSTLALWWLRPTTNTSREVSAAASLLSFLRRRSSSSSSTTDESGRASLVSTSARAAARGVRAGAARAGCTAGATRARALAAHATTARTRRAMLAVYPALPDRNRAGSLYQAVAHAEIFLRPRNVRSINEDSLDVLLCLLRYPQAQLSAIG